MRVFMFCLILFSTNCAKKASSLEQDAKVDKAINKTIATQLGENHSQFLNEANTLLLVHQNNAEKNKSTKYIVLNNANGELIAKGSFKAGYVKWKTDNALEVFDVPGIIPQGKTQTDYIKIVNLPTQKN